MTLASSTKQPLIELKAILEAMDFFELVSFKPVPITQETNFPSAYINLEATLNEDKGKMIDDGSEYNRYMYPILQLNLDLSDEDDLYYLDVMDKVESAIKKDNQLWEVVINRDVLGSKWDGGEYLPKKQGEIALSLFYRKLD